MSDNLILLEFDTFNEFDSKRLDGIYSYCDESKFVDDYRCAYKNKNARFYYVLFDTKNNEVLGRLLFNMIIKDLKVSEFLLINIATIKGKGYGKIMMEYLKEKARDMKNVNKIKLVSDFRSKGFYEGQGFVKEGMFYVYNL